jgi:glyoxylase-like metal-dependent hydrolase (beta-lactamase superfamily II)
MSIGRRELLSMLVVQAARLRAQSRLVDPQQRGLFDLQKVSRHVWIALARPAALLNCNAVIFELFDGLLVVDTHSKPSAAAALVAQLRREVPAKPVRYVVNTHFHYDHAHGNAGYRGTPGAVILASSETRRLLLERSGAFAASSVEGMKRTLATARARAGESAYWRQMALEAEAYIAEMSSFRAELAGCDVFRGDGGA